ncbi:MAG: MFS transporter [Coriobacteriales bacterium]|jgi:predicted MFS family arabinose efflux permease|nr:MFS transporter [Coriobacteriales bacterium]
MKTPNKWLMFTVLLISAIMVGISQLKIAAVLPNVAEMLNVDMTQASLLMSLFTVAGIALSIPGAAFMTRVGAKPTLLILMASLALGNILGALTDSFAVVMASRIIEGISYALIITVGIELISIWFADGGQATATGIFNTFAAAANFIAMNISLAIMNSLGLKALWWIVGAASVACFVLVLFVVKVSIGTSRQAEGGQVAARIPLSEAFRNPAAMVTCVALLFLSFVLFAFITCYPQLFAFYQLSQETSNFYASLNGLFGIPVCIVAGLVIERTGKPFIVAIIGAIGCILLGCTVPLLAPGLYVWHVIASAIFPGGLALTSIFIIVPRLARSPQLIGLTMGILNTLYYIGVFASTPVITALSQNNTNWSLPAFALTGASVGILICMVIAQGLAKKQEVERE